MAVELDHSFTTARPIDESYATIVDLERSVPCVEGGTVIERTGPDSVKAEIKVKMGAMGLKFTGTVEVVEQDPAAHRGPGARQRHRHLPAPRRRRGHPHQRADHGHGRVDGRGCRRRGARRHDRGLQRQARGALTDGEDRDEGDP